MSSTIFLAQGSPLIITSEWQHYSSDEAFNPIRHKKCLAAPIRCFVYGCNHATVDQFLDRLVGFLLVSERYPSRAEDILRGRSWYEGDVHWLLFLHGFWVELVAKEARELPDKDVLEFLYASAILYLYVREVSGNYLYPYEVLTAYEHVFCNCG